MQEPGTADKAVEEGAGATDQATEVAGQAIDYSVQADLQRGEGESSDRIPLEAQTENTPANAVGLEVPGPTYAIDDVGQRTPTEDS
ncbi:MAG: hypothetical protein JO316_16845 [Abitibacteriaceae bacterium]|nr:hypothetical protein [Abditibacteriaceae bacterium]MBV9867023.1 hypothetical protein [Abditibacteriaceae bacterium]